MPSLDTDFNRVMEKVRSGRGLGQASDEPIYYLVFPPTQILEVKRRMPAWTSRLRNDGWAVETYSIADAVAEIFAKVPPKRRELWLKADRADPLDWPKINESLAQALSEGAEIKDRLVAKLEEIGNRPNTILLVTGLEALHPYCRIGAVESQLLGSFKVPTVFFYPGVREGKTKLSFLGFYPGDGNYRSVHVGG